MFSMGNWGALGRGIWNAGGRTGQGALIGAGIGGAYGAMSDNTSVLGGMAIGAGLGAGGARYGGAGLLAATKGFTGGFNPRAFGQGVKNMVGRDYLSARMAGRSAYRGATQRANKAMNSFPGLGFRVGPGA